MKKLSILFFCVFTTFVYSQKNLKSPNKSNMSLVEVMVAAGMASGISNFSDNSYAGNGNYFELSSTYYFSKIGIGATVGQFSNPTKDNITNSTNQIDFPVTNSSGDWKTTYFGVGPFYKMNLGKFETTLFAQGGIMSTKSLLLSSNYSTNNPDIENVSIYKHETTENTTSGFYNAGLRLGYKINPTIGVFVSAQYLGATSENLKLESSTANIQDLDGDGLISEEELLKQVSDGIDYKTSTTNTKVETFNYGIGLTYSFGKKPNKTVRTEKPHANSQSNPYFVDSALQGEMMAMNSGSVVFTNPSKERAEKKNKQQKITGVLPKNNSVFKNIDEIKNFTWEVIGTKIPNPQFIIEVSKIGNNQHSQQIYIEETSKTSLGATTIFKENKISEGQYRWKVIETTTGNSSDVKFFTFSNCEIDFAISNEEIECLGYEGENRKFKICFDSTYSSTSGDLTFASPGSGLSVFDQTYAALTYTMVSPNPTLLTQIGATSTTVSYCFEVTVPASVTAIGFGLQGDDLDPSPVLCQPGVSASFDELPDCICDDCEDIELSFDNFNISLNGTSGNQFNFDGDINVNVPIYGIEFQIQSYSYTANPSACTEGVSGVEESGMLLMPGTTINGSASLQLANETASGSASSNDNATKNIKYISNSPLTGAIPVNLTIGLPGPISGLDPSCCAIDYTVCIKVKVFYEEGNCKSCVFTHCFNFNNQ